SWAGLASSWWSSWRAATSMLRALRSSLSSFAGAAASDAVTSSSGNIATSSWQKPPGAAHPDAPPPAARGDRSPALPQLHRPVRVVEEGLPRLVLAVGQLQVQQRAALRLLRLADQAHVRLLGGAAALADVAPDAGTDDVVPDALAALAARHDVIQAQLVGRE